MKIAIIGTNGMLSTMLTKAWMLDGHDVDTWGRRAPVDYDCSSFSNIDLSTATLDVQDLLNEDIIVYAAAAAVQAALTTDSLLTYWMNVNVPISLSLRLKEAGYKGVFISFGSYMEIGVNNQDGKRFTEEDVVSSILPVTNDYALSKRLCTRFMNDFTAQFTHWHFILPNMFSYNDVKPGTRLIPYVLQYIRAYKSRQNPAAPSFSAGLQTRQYILMEELIDVIHYSLIKNLPSGIYNVGGGEFASIRRTIESLFEASGVPCEDEYFGKEVRRDGDVKSLCLDGSKLLKAIGFLPCKKMSEVLVENL